MPDTFLGRRYARNIKRGYITLADVLTPYIQDVGDSYKELYGVPLDVEL